MTRAEILSTLSAAMPELRSRYGVDGLSIFGSVARDEHDSQSDVDVLVTFSRPVSLFGLASLRLRLVEILGREVDLGTPNSLRPFVRERVMHEALRVA
jgi:hypothetical protein